MSVVLIGLVTLVVGGLGGLLAVLWQDSREGPCPEVGTDGHVGDDVTSPFLLGRLPGRQQVMGLAAVAGDDALRAVLHAMARRQGLLVNAEGGALVVPDVGGLDPWTARLRDAILTSGGTSPMHVQQALVAVVGALRPGLLSSSPARALWRDAGTRAGVAVVGAFFGVAFVVVAVAVRLPVALFGGVSLPGLALVVGLAATVGGAVAFGLSARHRHARAYFAWLRAHTAAWQADAERGTLAPHEAAIGTLAASL